MVEESTSADIVETAHRANEAMNRGDLDSALSSFGPDSVWDDSALALGTHEGLAAIRQHCEDWIDSYEEFEKVIEQYLDLGNGIGFGVYLQKGRPVGSTGYVQLRYASVVLWVEGEIERTTMYTDVDEPARPPNGSPSRGARGCRKRTSRSYDRTCFRGRDGIEVEAHSVPVVTVRNGRIN